MANQYSIRKPTQMLLPLDGLIVEIPLTKGLVTIIDAIDSDLAYFKWQSTEIKHSGTPYAVGMYANGRTKRLHRVILERVLGRELSASEICDHINGNGLDNRRSNIRLCTQSQNAVNRKSNLNNTSGYKGVTWHQKTQKWRAVINVNKRAISLGYFRTPEEASEVYKENAKKYYGDFARED